MKRFVISLSLLLSGLANAQETAPPCLSAGRPLPINNEQVIQFKHTTPNNYRDRGHVTGQVTQVFKNATGHNHFEITLAAAPATTLEVIYDMKFGNLPPVKVGDSIEACGDYITANANSGGYRPSPDGALIHWVHRSDNAGHAHGYLIINNAVYGQN